MKNTSIFIPLLLIGCLAALIYLFFAALSAAEEDQDNGPARITLNEEDYRSAADDEATTLDARNGNTGTSSTGDANTSANEADFSAYLEEVPEDEKVTSDDTRTTGSTGGTGQDARTAVSSTPPARTTTTTTTTRPAAAGGGRYLVIAGTFRQAEGAAARVASLRAAGFSDARAERFNRGAYSVALAGQYDRYSSAQKRAGEVSRKGFEVRVMKRR